MKSKKAPYWLSTLSAFTTTLMFLVFALAARNHFFLMLPFVILVAVMGSIFLSGLERCWREGWTARPE